MHLPVLRTEPLPCMGSNHHRPPHTMVLETMRQKEPGEQASVVFCKDQKASHSNQHIIHPHCRMEVHLVGLPLPMVNPLVSTGPCLKRIELLRIMALTTLDHHHSQTRPDQQQPLLPQLRKRPRERKTDATPNHFLPIFVECSQVTMNRAVWRAF